MTRVVVFQWNGTPAVIPAELVVAFLHDPAIAPLPAPYGDLNQMIAYDSDLYPLINDPVLQEDEAENAFTTVIVTHNEHGNVALRVATEVDMELCDVESDSFVSFADGRTALLLDTAEILESSLPKGLAS